MRTAFPLGMEARVASSLTIGHSCLQEFINGDIGFAQDGPQRSFRHITGVVWKRDFAARYGVPPDFMATWTGAIKCESERAELPSDLAIFEPRESGHQRMPTGTTNSRGGRRDFLKA